MRTIITLAALGAGLLCPTAGCTKDGDTFIQQVVSGALLPGNFPGAPSTTHNKAADGGALSESGGVGFPAAAPRYFASGVGNRGVVLYTVNTGGNWWLYAHYFDGTTFTPPVALAGGNQDTSLVPRFTDAAVLFLDQPGQARDGDALIFWRQDDLDDFITNNIGANIRLYFSYFDRSLAGTAASGTNGRIRYGFDSQATAIDNSDDTGADVTCFALFSDGLHGMASWMGAFGNQFSQGDPVSFGGVVFLQSSFANPTLQTAFFSRFDTATGTMTAAAALNMDGGFTLGTDDVIDSIATYDGSAFFIYNDGSSPTYQYAVWQVFNSSGGPANGFLSSGRKLTPGTSTLNGLITGFVPGWGGVIGPDEGLVNVVGVFEVVNMGFAGNIDIYAFQVNPATGAALGGGDLVEIDADTTNSSGNPQPCVNNSIYGGVNRIGEFALITWRQTRGNSAANNGLALWSRAIQLTRSGTAPSLSTRTAGSGAQQVDSVTTGNNTTTNQVQRVKLQQDVYPGCGAVQSDRYTMHVLWQQDDAVATDDRVHTRRVTFTPDTSGSNPPAPTLGTDRQLPAFNNGELSNTGGTTSPGGWGSVIGVDAGGAGGAAGDLAVYYVQNVNATSPASFRAFQRIEAGTARAIGSLGTSSSGSNQECVELEVKQVPGSADLTNNPNWAGTLHHIFLSEARSGDPSATGGGPDLALRHRVYDKTDTDPVFDNRFTPTVNSTSPPFTLDQPGLGSSSFGVGFLASGTTNGVFWLQGGHFWYTEYDTAGRSWWTQSGVSKPEIIDHDSNAYITGFGFGVNATQADPCDNLRRFLLFWLKPNQNDQTAAPTLDRWSVRVRD